MIAAAAAPTTSVSTMTSDVHEPSASAACPFLDSERLTDAEVHPPAPRLRRAVDQQPRDRIQLIAEVEADRADRRLVAQAGADGVAQVVETEAVRQSAQTLPASRNSTPPKLPRAPWPAAPSLNANMLSPPIGSPDSLSGLTS